MNWENIGRMVFVVLLLVAGISWSLLAVIEIWEKFHPNSYFRTLGSSEAKQRSEVWGCEAARYCINKTGDYHGTWSSNSYGITGIFCNVEI